MKSLLLALLSFTVAATATAENLYIPVAGVVRGANNTLFRTDVRLFNPSFQHDIGVTLHFLPQGIDGTNIPGRVVQVPKRQMVVLNNVVETLFNMPSGSIGALRIDSDVDVDYDIIAESRTYTDSPNPSAPGTYGQFIPALDPADARRKTIVTHLIVTPEFRSNVGVMNPGREEATVKLNLFGADGTLLGTRDVTLTIPPKSMRMVAVGEIFGGVFMPDGFVLVESTGNVFSFGSVIDNRSGDPIFVPGVEDKAEIRPLALPE